MCARSSRRIGQLPPLHSRWPPPPNNAGSPDGGVAGSTPAAPSSRVHARQRGIRSNPLIFPDSGLGKQQVTADRQQLRASARLTAEARSEASSAVYVLVPFLSSLRPTFLGASTVASTVGRMSESVIRQWPAAERDRIVRRLSREG